MIKIALHAEYIATFLGVPLTNTFITTLIVTAILTTLGIIFYFKRDTHQSLLINGIRVLIFELLKLTDTVTQDRKLSEKLLPLVATFFLFIVTANLLALIPGFLGSLVVRTPAGEFALLKSPNSDLTTTVALALFSVGATQVASFKLLGIKKYLRRFFNFTNPIKFILGFFEMISEGVKVLSFSFRLFGNIFAGEVLLLVIGFLIPYIVPLPFMILEVFVGIVQAFIFAILTLTFIKASMMQEVN